MYLNWRRCRFNPCFKYNAETFASFQSKYRIYDLECFFHFMSKTQFILKEALSGPNPLKKNKFKFSKFKVSSIPSIFCFYGPFGAWFISRIQWFFRYKENVQSHYSGFFVRSNGYNLLFKHVIIKSYCK